MKKVIRHTLSVLVLIVIVVLMFLKLQGNKAENAKVIELSNVKGRFYPVRKFTLKKENLSFIINVNGFLKPFTDLNVVSETQGRIIEIYKERGDYVKVGDVIAKVDDLLLKAKLDATEAAIRQLEKDEKRFIRLHEQHAVTFHQLEEIQLNLESTRAKYIAAKRQLEDTEIKAPVSGLINDDFIEQGQLIAGGMTICNIIDNSLLKLNVKLAEHELKRVKEGQKVKVQSDVYPGYEFVGKVNVISKKAGIGNSFDVEIRVVNTKEHPLRAGMFVSVELKEQSESNRIFIPRRSIIGSLKDPFVYLINENIVKSQKILVGEILGDYVEVLEGLQSSDEIVLSGTYSIYDGASVKVMN